MAAVPIEVTVPSGLPQWATEIVDLAASQLVDAATHKGMGRAAASAALARTAMLMLKLPALQALMPNPPKELAQMFYEVTEP